MESVVKGKETETEVQNVAAIIQRALMSPIRLYLVLSLSDGTSIGFNAYIIRSANQGNAICPLPF